MTRVKRPQRVAPKKLADNWNVRRVLLTLPLLFSCDHVAVSRKHKRCSFVLFDRVRMRADQLF